MNIKTKYDVGEDVLYFHCNTMKLVEALIKGVSVSIDTANNIEILYTLNLNEDCLRECEVIDDLINYLRGDRELVNPLIVPEKLLFANWYEFEKSVSPYTKYEDPVTESAVMGSVTITLTKDVNT